MTKDEAISKLIIRRDLAFDTWEFEIKSKQPNIRTKESSWGKLVAYNHALKIISKIK
jgi:hypothetical protein